MESEKYQARIEQVNDLAMKDIGHLIRQSENNYANQITRLVDSIIGGGKKIVLVAGPSSAGKTTSAYKIKQGLIGRGINAFVISLDDFLFSVDELPLKPNGKPDFETVYSLDIHCVQQCLNEILFKNRTALPIFDFRLGRRSDKWIICSLKPNDVVIIEGLHALNPLIIGSLDSDKFFRVYVQTNTVFSYNDKPLISGRELRLFRRIIRDSRERNTNPLRTVTMWADVCHGEDIYIRPHMHLVEYFLDTTHLFEPLMYKNIAIKQLSPLDNSLAKTMLSKLNFVGTIDGTLVPSDSLVREFYKNDDL
ncbi:MAG: nucleoside kinase [Christensenellaceae bacterium]|jgi:uridine kinase|nr:nucleoside kinase [Christensenellaceae bacterium]